MHFDRNRLQTLNETSSAETALWKGWKKRKISHVDFVFEGKVPISNHLK